MSVDRHDLPSAIGADQTVGAVNEDVLRHPVEFPDDPVSRAANAPSAVEALQRLVGQIEHERGRADGFAQMRADADAKHQEYLAWTTERETTARTRLDDLLGLLPAAEAGAAAESARKSAEATEARLHELTEADRAEAVRLALVAELEAELEAETTRVNILEADAAELREALAALDDACEEP